MPCDEPHKLVQSLGITGLSTSQVSEMAKNLDAHVEQFRTRPLDETGAAGSQELSSPGTEPCGG